MLKSITCINGKRGHFWLERFKSKIVEKGSYFINTVIYFALNPVKAGITDNPLEYRYSSIQSVVSDKYSDLLEPLDDIDNDIIREFLNREGFIEKLLRLQRTLKRFSFRLTKSRFDQRFRDFIGSNNFIRDNNIAFSTTKSHPKTAN